MKLSQIVLLLGMSFLIAMPVFAQNYSIVIMPNSFINSEKIKTTQINYDELLAKKIISEINSFSKSSAPDLENVKSYINTNNQKDMKILADNYNVEKILIIKSFIDSKTANQQKIYWQKLGAPIIIQYEINKKIITTANLYDTINNKIIWNDTYYKNINSDLNIKNETISNEIIKKYYTELAPKIVEHIKVETDLHKNILASDIKPKTKKIVKSTSDKTCAKNNSEQNKKNKMFISKTKDKNSKVSTKQKLHNQKTTKTLDNISMTNNQRNSIAIMYINTCPRIKSRAYKLVFVDTINEF